MYFFGKYLIVANIQLHVLFIHNFEKVVPIFYCIQAFNELVLIKPLNEKVKIKLKFKM